ncbi:MAG: type II secretion system F family protein [Planctomycetota bacterium]
MRLPWPRRDENVAERLEDVASALQAGLPVEAIVDGPATEGWRRDLVAGAEEGLTAALRARGAPLEGAEWAMLRAAEKAGRLPEALLARARGRRQRAQVTRTLLAAVRYPIGVLVFGLLLVLVIGGGTALVTAATLILVAVPLGWWALRRALQSPSFTGWGIPGLRGVLRDAAEIPYLESLQGLYAAGVPLRDAHEEAARTVPIGAARYRLLAAAAPLDQGATLTEALTTARGLGDETLRLLRAAELAGDLEGALGRSLQRRRDTLERRVGRAARVIGVVVYAAVALWVAWFALDFYSGLYGRFAP